MSKISELSDGGSLLPTDFLIAVRSGGNVKVQADQTEFDRIRLGDNEKIELGNNQDLQIYHDPSGPSSLISDQGAGDLILRGSNQIRFQDATGAEHYAIFNENGAVQLYYDNAAKLATTATGIDVTGAVNSDTLDVTGSTDIIARFRDSTNGIIDIKTTGTTNADPMQINGSNRNIELAVNGLAKLATTTTGIDVTGTATADGLTVTKEGTDHLKIIDTSSSNDLTVGIGNTVGSIAVDPTGSVASSKLDFSIDGNTAIRMAEGGDISFYEDTGTTAKLTWDASAESLNFADNAKAIFGAGSDLQIYHDGSHSYISDVGEGPLRITTDGTGILLNKTTTESMGRFLADGAVELYYDNALKLATTATGIDVTGSVAADDSSSADSTILTLANSYTTDAAGDATEIMFQHYRSYSPSVTDSAFIKATKTQAWDATGDRTSKLEFGTRNGAAEPETRMTIMPDGLVGIGTSSPSSYPVAPNLVVDAGTNGGVTIKSGTSNYGGVFFADGTTGNEQYRGFIQYNHNYAGSTDELLLGTSGAERLSIGSTGIIYVNGDGTGGRLSGDGSGGLVLEDGNGRQSFKIMSPSSGSVQAMTLDANSNLLVGKTASSFTTAGVELAQGGTAGKVQIMRASGGLAVVNTTDDGAAISIYKGTSAVGSIGVASGDLNINGPVGHSGIRFQASSILPRYNGADTDGTMDLGYYDGTDTHRWRDLYLSGGAYLGGTAAANKLDDVETGTFTPTWIPASGSGQTIASASGWYTKVGNRVFIDIHLATNGHGTASGNLSLGGLPFTQTTNSGQNASLSCGQAANAGLVAGQAGAARVDQSGTTITPLVWSATTGTTTITAAQWGVSGTWRFTGSYQV